MTPPRHARALPGVLRAAALGLAASLLLALPWAAAAAPTATAGAGPALADGARAAAAPALVEGDYSARALRIDGFDEPVPVRGHFVAPADAGPHPFALFLHGKHTTCYRSSDGLQYAGWPCPRGAAPVPSYLGFRYLQRALAERGYVTASVMANGVDGQEDRSSTDSGVAERSQLVRRHLRLWSAWTTGETPGPDGTDWTGRVDLSRTVLVGHSRGGEGVVRAAVDATPASPWRVRSLVLLAPADNTRQVAPQVPTTVLMGYCDGDLNFWPGQGYLDVARDLEPTSAQLSAVSVTGANHAWFNTEWTPGLASTPAGDDGSHFYGADHELCAKDAPSRLTAAEQRAVARSYVTAATDVFVDGDTTSLSMFDGRAVAPEQVGGAHVQVTPLGGHRVLLRPGADATLRHGDGATARMCRGYAGDAASTSCGRGVMWERAPHWLPSYSSPATPTAPAAELSWSVRGASAGLAARSPLDLGDSTALDARVVVDPKAGPVRLAFRLTDADGESVVLTPRDEGRLAPMPGSGRLLHRLWGQLLRAPLSGLAQAGVDGSAITSVDLVSRNGSGRVWLLDLSGWRRGLVAPSDTYVPRIGVVDARQPEGGRGDHVLVVPLSVTGTLSRDAVVSVQVIDETLADALPPVQVQVPAGASAGTLEIPYTGDRAAGPNHRFTVNLWARSGAVVGRQQGFAVAVDDD